MVVPKTRNPKNTKWEKVVRVDTSGIPEELNALAKECVDAAYVVHSTLGPGLLEAVYEACLAYELRKRGHKVEVQVCLPVTYGELKLEAGLRIDMLVDGILIIEVKSALRMHPVYEQQLLNYLKLARKQLGLLINFNVANIGEGIKRKVR